MARNKRKSSGSRSRGSSLYGLLAGLILGLAAAVAVALFVTKVPMPFADKATRAPSQTLLPDVRDAPDPNLGLYGKDSPAGIALHGPTDTSMAPLPGPGAGSPSLSDNIGDLIATLTRDNKTEKLPAPVIVPGTEAEVPRPRSAAPAKAAPGAAEANYYLQAGAFRSESDAEAVKARILMLGLPAQVQKAQVNGGTINRVRVGPFTGIDEMNRSRARLGEEQIASSVVRQ